MNGNYSIKANFEEIPPIRYNLTISSTAGGSVTTPGQGTFTYDAGTVVSMVATPASGYRFINWTGDVATLSCGCQSTTITMNGNYSVMASFAQEEAVFFPDPNLEAVIREAIGKATGPIYSSDLGGLTSLSASEKSIHDLTGLEHCTSLTSLDLGGNQISDISPLAGLVKLTNLNLWHDNVSDVSVLVNHTSLTSLNLGGDPINDMSPLSNLTNLTWLDIHGHGYHRSDIISPLANLTNLAYIHAGGNDVSDISVLANFTKLIHVNISNNQISDISPLTSLTKLTILELGWNQINDISPLIQNDGLGAGDVIYLPENPLSSDSSNIYVPELQARGVTVELTRGR
jgi:Leucine-rich repeat (LRR) protein